MDAAVAAAQAAAVLPHEHIFISLSADLQIVGDASADVVSKSLRLQLPYCDEQAKIGCVTADDSI